MTTKQYRALLGKLGVTQIEMGELLGVQWRQAQRYATGESRIPEAFAILARMLRDEVLTFEQIKQYRSKR
jgi:hypothetical protein